MYLFAIINPELEENKILAVKLVSQKKEKKEKLDYLYNEGEAIFFLSSSSSNIKLSSRVICVNDWKPCTSELRNFADSISNIFRIGTLNDIGGEQWGRAFVKAVFQEYED